MVKLNHLVIELCWSLESLLSTFLNIVDDYSEVMAGVGIVILLYTVLLLISVALKALESLRAHTLH